MGWRSREYAVEYSGQKGRGRKDPNQDALISKFLPFVPSLVLDAGGGDGRWSLGFRELGYEVCFVDFNVHMVRMAHGILQHTGVNVVMADIRFLPFRNEVFDFVLCEANPISQCGSKGESVRAVTNLFNVLKKGAVLVGSLSNRYFWLIKMLTEAKDETNLEEVSELLDTGILKPKSDAQMYLFTPNEFVDNAKKVGFNRLELIPYPGFIASEFLAKNLSCQSPIFSKKLNEIENKLLKDKQSLYFSRRFRFAMKKG